MSQGLLHLGWTVSSALPNFHVVGVLAAELLLVGEPGAAMGGDGPLLAKYANWFNIGHDNFEFVLDFGQSHAEIEPITHTRIVAGPAYAKLLAKLLNESLARYEETFGAIPDAECEEP